jgi:hypothetical protein
MAGESHPLHSVPALLDHLLRRRKTSLWASIQEQALDSSTRSRCTSWRQRHGEGCTPCWFQRSFETPIDARKAGVTAVYQDPMSVDGC